MIAPIDKGRETAVKGFEDALSEDEKSFIIKHRAEILEQIDISIKYEGYIRRQQDQVEHFLKMEGKRIPKDIDYSSVRNLRKEARQKLEMVRPETIGQASRISGVSPADISMLMIHLK